MKYIILSFLIFTAFNSEAKSDLEHEFYTKAKPVIAKYCAGCHDGQTAPDYTEYETAVQNRSVIYNRVFVLGDMPWRLRLSTEDQLNLKSWLLREQ